MEYRKKDGKGLKLCQCNFNVVQWSGALSSRHWYSGHQDSVSSSGGGELIKLNHGVDDIPFLNSICSDFVLAKKAPIIFLVFKTPQNRKEVYPLLY